MAGRVQGVFFRASAQRAASSLGLRGWARNLDDGRVEVVACGPQDKVKELCDWLWLGPSHAKVSQVICEDLDREPRCADFQIR